MVLVLNMALFNPELPVVAGDETTELLLEELMATSDSDLPHTPVSFFSRETNEAYQTGSVHCTRVKNFFNPFSKNFLPLQCKLLRTTTTNQYSTQ